MPVCQLVCSNINLLVVIQMTWGTPVGKREECSFKGKNLEVSGSNIVVCLDAPVTEL